MNIIDGREVATTLLNEVRERVEQLKSKGVQPRLAILTIGDDARTASYIRAKQRAAERVDIQVDLYPFSAEDEGLEERIRTHIERLNSETEVHGIIVQLPIPQSLDSQALIDLIDPKKDVDGLTATNRAGLELGRELMTPATPMGVIRLLKAYDVPVAGAKVALIGHGRLVGSLLAPMLRSRGAEVHIADSRTKDLAAVTLPAAIIISAVGKANLVTASMVQPHSVLIDVGLSEIDERLVGDISAEAKEKARLATPVPGGVGPMTVASLLSNTVFAAELQSLNP